ncbi:Phospholipid-transporting ATPase 1 [Hordeum vulgare]|nr:Phospholipid-transporting ATPase 1 [Hordeum vulgare]
MEEVGEGEKPRPRRKTNSKKKDKWDAASIALIATMEGMMTKKDSRKEKQDKEEKMNDFMKIRRRGLEIKAEKQTRMLDTEAEKQTKMLEIEAANANAKTNGKEVALANMMTNMEIMKVDLNTVSSVQEDARTQAQVHQRVISMAASSILFVRTVWRPSTNGLGFGCIHAP